MLKLRTYKVILGCIQFEYFYINPNVAGRRLIQPPKNVPTPSYIRLLRIDRKDLILKTSEAICKDIARRDAAIAYNKNRRQDGRRKPSTRQDQPEAKISPVSTEQDDYTAPPPTGILATTTARPVEKEKRPTQFPKL